MYYVVKTYYNIIKGLSSSSNNLANKNVLTFKMDLDGWDRTWLGKSFHKHELVYVNGRSPKHFTEGI